MQRQATGILLRLAARAVPSATAGSAQSSGSGLSPAAPHAVGTSAAAPCPSVRALCHLAASSSCAPTPPLPLGRRGGGGGGGGGMWGCAAAPPLLPCPPAAGAQLQRAAGIKVVVNVRNNNVDAAYGRLNRHCTDNGLYTELRRREYRETNHEAAFKAKRAAFNKRMGAQIRERLRWIVKRRHM